MFERSSPGNIHSAAYAALPGGRVIRTGGEQFVEREGRYETVRLQTTEVFDVERGWHDGPGLVEPAFSMTAVPVANRVRVVHGGQLAGSLKQGRSRGWRWRQA